MAPTTVAQSGRRLVEYQRPRRSRILTTWISGALVASVVFGLAYDNGSYGLGSRSVLAIVVWWTCILGIGLGLWPRQPVPRAALACGTLLALFAAWTFASLAWTWNREATLEEFDRVSMFVGVFVLIAVAARRQLLSRYVDALTVAVAAIAAVALTSRFFPSSFPDRGLGRFLPATQSRLSFPLGYWNGLAIFCAFGFPLLLRGAAAWRNPVARGLAVAAIPLPAAVIYLASSRGGIAAAGTGILAVLLLGARRWAVAAALAIGGAGSAVAIAVLQPRNELVNGPIGSAAAVSQGHEAAGLLLLVGVLAGFVFAVGTRVFRSTPSRLVGRAVTAGLVGLTLIGLIAAHPVERFHAFTRPPQPLAVSSHDFVRAHLLSGNGSGRWQFWSAALDEWRDRPLTGHGAGTFQAWWLQHGSFSYFLRDAHSLYLEALGELGLIGFALLIGALGVGFVTAIRRVLRCRDSDDRLALAALLALVVAWLVGAGIDWMWELTVVTVVAVGALAVLTGNPSLPAIQPAVRPRRRFAFGFALIAVAWVAIAANALSWLAQLKIESSQAAVSAGNAPAAAADALAAKNLTSWAASPYLQLALVTEQTGALGNARMWIAEAIARDEHDWRLWLVAARVDTKRGRVRAARADLSRAAELNPRSPLFQGTAQGASIGQAPP